MVKSQSQDKYLAKQIRAAKLFSPPTRITLLLILAGIDQKEIAILSGKSQTMISICKTKNYPGNPTKRAIYNALLSRLPEMADVLRDTIDKPGEPIAVEKLK